MAQRGKWEDEYRKPKLVTKDDKPQADTLKFLKWLRKEQGIGEEGLSVLDVGSGAGRNANYLAEQGARVTGLEISSAALSLAEQRAKESRLSGAVRYVQHDIGKEFPVESGTFDLALDIMSSNSLTEREREICVSEIARSLIPGGWLYMKALCKDGDKNARNLLKTNPGSEQDTYSIPGWGLVERVWTEHDFTEYYSRFFDIIGLEKKTNYATFNTRTYKRNYWIAYMRKR